MALRFTGIRVACSRIVIRDRILPLSRPQTNVGFYRRMCTKKEADVVKVAEQSNSSANSSATVTQSMGKGMTGHRTNLLDRIFLVWGGKYKSLKAVPMLVSQDTMEFYRNKARIKINIMMGIGTLLGCMVMVWSGKLAVERGETVSKMNQDFHKAYKLQKQKDMEAAANEGHK